jgi:hypothetical protein
MRPPRDRAFVPGETMPAAGAMLYHPRALRDVPEHDPRLALGADFPQATSGSRRADR